MKSKKIYPAVYSAFTFFLLLGILFLFLTMRFVHYSPYSYTESAEEIQNPYVGWYQIYNYMLSDDTSPDLSGIPKQESRPGLALLEFNLKAYADRPVSDYGLSLLDQILQSWQSSGRQLIVRFFYDWEGNAMDAEPGELSLILTHMSQTAETINRYSDCVYILQGIFIGSWGEMHGSHYANYGDMVTLMNHLDSVITPEIFLAVRTPQQWRLLADSEEPVEISSAFNGSLPSRLSLFNDGMLGSDTDLNTYAISSNTGDYSRYHKSSRQDEIDFQNRLCAFVPNGGEVVLPNPRNDFSAAVSDLSAAHVSYLNSAYDEAVFSKWRTVIYTEDSPYSGLNGFDYISRHLGYRYVLRSSECASVFPWKKNAEVNVILQNVGFSGSYRPFDVSLTLKKMDTGETFSLPADTDTRFWESGEQILLTFPIAVRGFATGTYEVFLQIIDPVSEQPIFFANEGTHSEYGFPLGNLELGILP
jgi:hypothetical protein